MSQRLEVVIVLYQMKMADTPNYLLLKEVVDHPNCTYLFMTTAHFLKKMHYFTTKCYLST